MARWLGCLTYLTCLTLLPTHPYGVSSRTHTIDDLRLAAFSMACSPHSYFICLRLRLRPQLRVCAFYDIWMMF
ncbi:hypothetical protein BO70DRAFT_60488 [Aspergillus heteromorphus CBS 117.55]|uniref:Secreted protein n=1 Tax=Aspergillus heteromorphus CBS 117.55 TaxID=1448321 RepID=A0A317VV41_9EURO|nr:uncharacterized protein BO70DRAFT_60488 [Aspergillus heteromorphus CBS 117.55]PWY78256.1 hypothetical protein BO70DRAFT_60488 [Aspergillus heteromorphus CBS 117.55]